MKMLGIEFAPLRVPFERRLQILSVAFCLTTIFQGMGYWIVLLYVALRTEYYYVAVAYGLWMWADRKTCERGGRSFQWVRKWAIWRYVRDYFPVRLIKTADLDPNKNYICGCHPHGILPVGSAACFATEALDFSENYPGITPYLTVLYLHFVLPVQRDLAMALGGVSVSKQSIDWILKNKGKGQFVCIYVGGVNEQLEAHPGVARLSLKRRIGFIRLALQNGASLVPSFSFGDNDVYYQVPNPEGSMVRRIQNAILAATGSAIPFAIGRGFFQYTFGFLPYRKPIDVVVGKPIDVEKVENPTQEEVDLLHRKYKDALKALYDEYKKNYELYKDTEMEFV